MRAMRKMVLEKRVEDCKQDLEELEYDYQNKTLLDGEIKVTEADYHYYKACLEDMLKEAEDELYDRHK